MKASEKFDRGDKCVSLGDDSSHFQFCNDALDVLDPIVPSPTLHPLAISSIIKRLETLKLEVDKTINVLQRAYKLHD